MFRSDTMYPIVLFDNTESCSYKEEIILNNGESVLVDGSESIETFEYVKDDDECVDVMATLNKRYNLPILKEIETSLLNDGHIYKASFSQLFNYQKFYIYIATTYFEDLTRGSIGYCLDTNSNIFYRVKSKEYYPDGSEYFKMETDLFLPIIKQEFVSGHDNDMIQVDLETYIKACKYMYKSQYMSDDLSNRRYYRLIDNIKEKNK